VCFYVHLFRHISGTNWMAVCQGRADEKHSSGAQARSRGASGLPGMIPGRNGVEQQAIANWIKGERTGERVLHGG
jgi:hypothetical protein